MVGRRRGANPVAIAVGAGRLEHLLRSSLPELFRRYAVADGAKLMLLCAEWPLARVEHWRSLLVARAIENQCFVVAVNSCGDTGGTVFAGHSMVVDPWERCSSKAARTNAADGGKSTSLKSTACAR